MGWVEEKEGECNYVLIPNFKTTCSKKGTSLLCGPWISFDAQSSYMC